MNVLFQSQTCNFRTTTTKKITVHLSQLQIRLITGFMPCSHLTSCSGPCLFCESGSVVSNSLQLHGLYSPWNSPDQNTGVGGLSLLQGIFPTQGLNPGLPHCRQILYQLSHKGKPNCLHFDLPFLVSPCSSQASFLYTSGTVLFFNLGTFAHTIPLAWNILLLTAPFPLLIISSVISCLISVLSIRLAPRRERYFFC